MNPSYSYSYSYAYSIHGGDEAPLVPGESEATGGTLIRAEYAYDYDVRPKKQMFRTTCSCGSPLAPLKQSGLLAEEKNHHGDTEARRRKETTEIRKRRPLRPKPRIVRRFLNVFLEKERRSKLLFLPEESRANGGRPDAK